MTVTVRLWGGLGNQLFLYAAARRLSLLNEVPLILDATSGFARDRVFKRQYLLHHFDVAGVLATPAQALEDPFGRLRRFWWRNFGQLFPVERRALLTDAHPATRAGFQHLRLRRSVYLEGYWQSEDYFRDVAEALRRDLVVQSAHTPANLALSQRIRGCEAVCIHARLLSGAYSADATPDAGYRGSSLDYYARAIDRIVHLVDRPHFFCFSDFPDWLREHLPLRHPATFVSHNRGDAASIEDFWLMSQCTHFIIANSTFSWWAAWLGKSPHRIVLTPNMARCGMPGLRRPFTELPDD